MESVAKLMNFSSISKIILPIKKLMLETNEIKAVRDMEELFRHLSSGINSNSAISVKSLMIFIHQLITETLPLAQNEPSQKKAMSLAEMNFTIQLKRTEAIQSVKYYETNSHLFIEFGLSLLLSSVKSEKIDFKIEEHIALFDPFVELLGKCLYSSHVQIVIFALKIITFILKAPLPSIDKFVAVIVKRIFQLIVTINYDLF